MQSILSTSEPTWLPFLPVEGARNGRTATDANGAELLAPWGDVRCQQFKQTLQHQLIQELDLSLLATADNAQLQAHVTRLAHAVVQASVRTGESLPYGLTAEVLVPAMLDEAFGLGPLQPLSQDASVSDILVNGPHEIYVERQGQLKLVPVVFADEAHLMQIIHKVVAKVGRRVDEQTPLVDARLPDGSRVHAVIPPLALNGPVLSIRRFGREPLQLQNLLAMGTMTGSMATFLQAAVAGKLNLLISGGSGAGKTTLLNVLSGFIPPAERLVSIEDAAELRLQNKHVVRLETRPENLAQEGAITQRELVRNSLRMRPDRIILGEVRGPEALDMLQAMNTGHEGSLTTIHANGTQDALRRLEVMVSLAGGETPLAILQRYIASSINLLIHVVRLKGGARKIMRISELQSLTQGEYQVQDIFRFQHQGTDEQGIHRGEFVVTGHPLSCQERLYEQGVVLPTDFFQPRVAE